MTLQYQIKKTGYDYSGIPCKYYEINFTYNGETKMIRINADAFNDTKMHKELIQMIKKEWSDING